jgi:hypothetical protein
MSNKKKRVFASVRERRLVVQQRPSLHQAHAPAATSSIHTITNQSRPYTWPLYNLETLELCPSTEGTMVTFADYISQNRLFRNLVTFKLQIPSLKVGQQKAFGEYHVQKPGYISRAKLCTPVEPAHFPNELLALRGMLCLEKCILLTISVPGLILAKDFRFLKRKRDRRTVSFVLITGKKVQR